MRYRCLVKMMRGYRVTCHFAPATYVLSTLIHNLIVISIIMF